MSNHKFHSEFFSVFKTDKALKMCFGYLQIGILVVVSIASVVEVDSYSDVDLRIAERKAIPHYIRHQYEYPEIDIKAIMAQRGIVPRPFNRDTHSNRGIGVSPPRPLPVHKHTAWKQYNRLAAQTNHVIPQHNQHYLKKQKYNRNSNNNKYNKNFNKYNKVKKFW